MKPNPVVVIAGSRALPQGQAPRLLIRFLAALPPSSTILLRRGLFTQPNIFEAQVEQLVDLIGLKLQWCQPDQHASGVLNPRGPEYKEGGKYGRQLTWARDVAMVERSDLVLTFFDAGQIGDETSGTVALIEKAVAANVPCYGYALWWHLDEDVPAVERVGEHDPTNLWADLVPQPE